jgi:hypothetical protein
MSAVIATTGCLSAGVIALSVALLPMIGVAAVGVGWLVAQTAIATVLLLGELRTVWLPYVPFEKLRAFAPRPRRGRRPTVAHDPVGAVAGALEEAGLTAATWAGADKFESTVGIRVVVVDGAGGDLRLKVATDEEGAVALRREVDALATIRSAGAPELVDVVPETLRASAGVRVWALETRRGGTDARRLFADPAVRERWTAGAIARLDGLFRATARLVVVPDEMPELLTLPTAALAGLPGSALRVRADAATQTRIEEELRAELTGRAITMARVHGNLWPGSLRCGPGGNVTGILGWERSHIGVPAADVVHLELTTRALAERRELGAVVREALTGGAADEIAARCALVPGGTELSIRTLVLLVWLEHVHDWLRGPEDSRPGAVWVSQNVHQVLESV